MGKKVMIFSFFLQFYLERIFVSFCVCMCVREWKQALTDKATRNNNGILEGLKTTRPSWTVSKQ